MIVAAKTALVNDSAKKGATIGTQMGLTKQYKGNIISRYHLVEFRFLGKKKKKKKKKKKTLKHTKTQRHELPPPRHLIGENQAGPETLTYLTSSCYMARSEFD
jgi:hypothetical protein